MLSYCANFKVTIYESTSLNRILTDKSHRVIVALGDYWFQKLDCVRVSSHDPFFGSNYYSGIVELIEMLIRVTNFFEFE